MSARLIQGSNGEKLSALRSFALNLGLPLIAFAAFFVAASATSATFLFVPAGVLIGVWGARVVTDHQGVGSEWARWRRRSEASFALRGLRDRDLMFLEGGVALVIGLGCIAIGLSAA